MLPEVVGDGEAFRCRGLDEDGLEVDLLWACIDLLKLFAGKLDAAVSHLCLGLRLRLPLALDDPVRIGWATLQLERLVLIDRLLYVEWIDFSR